MWNITKNEKIKLINLYDKLDNMCESEISEITYEFLKNKKNFNVLEQELVNRFDKVFAHLKTKYDSYEDYQAKVQENMKISDNMWDEIYDNDAFYMDAINSLFAKDIIPCECGCGKIRMKNIIVISGKAGSGKDFAASYIKSKMENYNLKVCITHYADLLKYFAKNWFGWNGEKDHKGRNLLQYIGTDIVRKKNSEYWVDFLKGAISMFADEFDYFIIADARFPNEIIDGISIRITDETNSSNLSTNAKQHISETALDDCDIDFDYYVTNDKTVNFKRELDKIMSDFLWK